jgi:lipopolysaccharide transport system permease protein
MSSHKESEHWDLIIKPQGGFLDLNLKDVWRYRDLLIQFIKRDFVAQYKQTVLGLLWNVIQPILTTIMFLLVFGKIANIPTDGIKAPLFYLSGITIWNYFATCFTSISTTFVTNATIFGKVYFPRLVLPFSVVFSNIIRFFIQFAFLLIVMVYYSFRGYPIHISLAWLLIPFLVILMGGIGLGLGIIISSITTKYRDFTVLVAFGVQLLMYATPIVYPLSFLMGKSYRWVIMLNPLTAVTEAFRYCLFDTSHFQWDSLLYSTLFMLVTLGLGLIMFSRTERTFMDTV